MGSIIYMLLFIFAVGLGKGDADSITITDIHPEIPLYASPAHISPAMRESLWIVSLDEPIIRLMDGAGNSIRSFGGFGTGFCEFSDRVDLVDSHTLFLYAVDTDNGRILKMNRGGVCVREIRNQLDESSEIWRPFTATVSKSGRIYIADSDAGTVHYIDTFDGLRVFIDPLDRGTAIPVQPVSLSCDGDILYIADGVDGTIYSFDVLGNCLGRKKSQFDIRSLAVTLNGYCAVVDHRTNDVYLCHWDDETWVSLHDLVPEIGSFEPSDIGFMHDSNTPGQIRYLVIVDIAQQRIVKLTVRFA